jgi:hypothetical protein
MAENNPAAKAGNKESIGGTTEVDALIRTGKSIPIFSNKRGVLFSNDGGSP